MCVSIDFLFFSREQAVGVHDYSQLQMASVVDYANDFKPAMIISIAVALPNYAVVLPNYAVLAAGSLQ